MKELKKEKTFRKFVMSFAATCLVFLGLHFAPGVASAQRTATGDRKLDSLLGKINEQAKADPDGIVHQLSLRHNIPEEEIRQVRERHHLSYGDTYMAAALSRISKRPIGVVAEEYNQDQGRGWGVMAMNMGIKPGSPEFMQMEANARGSVDHIKTLAKDKKAKGRGENKWPRVSEKSKN
jgi:hypothetical protein